MELSNGPLTPGWPLRLAHPHGPLFRLLPLALRRHLLYWRAMGSWGNFRRPRTKNEKMQWRIINDRRPIVAMSCDKLACKEYARDVATGEGLNLRIPQTYWVGTDVRDLQSLASKLPARWVLKPNHSSGRFALIDTSVQPVDWERLIAVCNRWVQRDEEELGQGHWGYGQARHLIFAEERIGDGAAVPGIKVRTTHGNVLGYSAGVGTPPHKKRWQYNSDFERIAREAPRFNPGDELSVIDLLSPESKQTLARLGSVLTRDFDHQRCDLYFANNEFWFGEYSIYATSGLSNHYPAADAAIAATWVLTSDPRGLIGQERFMTYLRTKPRATLSGGA